MHMCSRIPRMRAADPNRHANYDFTLYSRAAKFIIVIIKDKSPDASRFMENLFRILTRQRHFWQKPAIDSSFHPIRGYHLRSTNADKKPRRVCSGGNLW